MEVGRTRESSIRKRIRMGPIFEGGDHPHDFRRAKPNHGDRTDNAGTHPVARRHVPMGSVRMEHIVHTHGNDTLLDQGLSSLHRPV